MQDIPGLWAAPPSLTGRQRLLLTALDAVYVVARAAKAMVSIRPKAAFQAALAESGMLTASISLVA